MAGFKTHLVWGLAGGGVLATAGYFEGHIDLKDAGAVVILGGLGGLLPDLDSDTGKPLELLFQMLSVLVPMLLYSQVKRYYGNELTLMLLFFTIGYLAVQYMFCPFIKKLTVHRGIMHSIPFAVLCGQVTFLLFAGAPQRVAVYCALAVFAGAMLHLMLDEFYSITFKGFTPRFNRASGTALALYSSSPGATLLVYLLLISIAYIIFGDGFGFDLMDIFAFLKRESKHLF